MQLRFDSFTGNDDDAFETARTTLLEEFETWLADNGVDDEDGEIVADTDTFLHWRFSYSTGELDDYRDSEIAEFFLEWCPRKVSAPPDSAVGYAEAVGHFARFLAATDRLVGGTERADRIAALTSDLAPHAVEAMGDPRNFGMAKSMMGSFTFPETDDPDELQAALDQQIATYNALPDDERMARSGGARPRPPATIELSYVHVPPSDAALAAEAAELKVLRQIEQLRGYLGEQGRAVTADDDLDPSDVEELIELLGTDDADDLGFIIGLAEIVEAVAIDNDTMLASPSWDDGDSIDHVVDVVRGTIAAGPLNLRYSDSSTPLPSVASMLDEGTIAQLAAVLDAGVASYDVLIDHACDVIAADHRDDLRTRSRKLFDVDVRRWAEQWIKVLVDVHAVRRDPDDPDAISLTEVGRFVIADIAPVLGFQFRTLDGLADLDADELLTLIGDVDVDPATVMAAWQPDLAADERARLLADAMATGSGGAYRLTGLTLLEAVGVEAAEPHVRELLATPAAGPAALWLLSHDLADEAAMDPYLGIGVLVDTLSAFLDDPDQLVAGFMQAGDQASSTIEEMWRHDAPETALVLDALGAHLPDKRLAKQARKAAFRHRSWIADQQRR